MRLWRRVWAWWWSGFLASASAAPRFALLLPPASGGGTESGDVLKWGYVTPASRHTKGRLDPGQGVSNVSSRSLLIGKLLDKAEKQENGKDRHPKQGYRYTEFSQPEFYLRRPAGSSVLLTILPSRKRRKVIWRFLSHEYDLIILEHVAYSNIVSFNSYFRHRVKYDLKTGSLLINRLEVEDSGLFEVILSELLVTNTIQSKYVHFHLEVQDQLLTPLIFQVPNYVLDRVRLSCVVKTGKATDIEWLKDGVQLKNHSHYRVGLDGTSLFIDNLEVSDCGLYTCRITNDVSKNQNTHFVTANGILLIIFYAYLMSVVALVSNSTSFIAAIMITFIIIRNTQVEKYRREFTTIFLTFQLLSFICLLIASLLCVCDSGFAPLFRIIAGFGCVFSVTMIIYVAVLFLNPETEESSIFVFNNYHRCTMYLLGPVSVLVPSVLLYNTVHIVLLEFEPRVKLKHIKRAR
ncbi:uncharacterized protein LOC127586054 [Pristis pectinata]|uniref:uncharacterized protein LOC127586054 n=1 Tax=Pristis pectinata TaxID=685728 RepID=UPI00223C94C3|nr:uncharacterized protein LOC127586054 [Pristis pectinata]